MTVLTELPLRWHTPEGWADAALSDTVALLNDHAHLERDAAANALALMRRIPDGYPTDRWVQRLTGVAREEIEHLGTVTRELTARGASLSRGHRNPYAADLRKLVRNGQGPRELADRLLVSALIELRSCERFGLLGEAGHEVSPLYANLMASEVGHYRLFVRLAEAAISADEVSARWDELLELEGAVAEAQPAGSRIHAGA